MSRVKRYLRGNKRKTKLRSIPMQEIKKIILEVTKPITAAEFVLPEGSVVPDDIKKQEGYTHESFVGTGEWVRQALFKRLNIEIETIDVKQNNTVNK